MKAQVAMEFMILFAIFMAAMAISIYYVWNNVHHITTATTDSEAMKVIEKVGGKIDTVYLEGDGFMTNVTVPYRVNGMNYTINAQNGLVWTTIQNRTYTRRLLTNDVSGSISIGVNALTNDNGTVVIS